MKEYTYRKLSNGIRLIHKYIDSPVAVCGLMIHTGSRDERPEEHGMAHFIEHMLFKGTERRKSFHVLSRLEDVGGELNAYTTKEETFIYGTVLRSDYRRAAELIKDVVFHSVFPEKEIAKEKEVVLEEINSYKDNPAELIFDEFEELIYRNKPIGRNILGSSESVGLFCRDTLLRFLEEKYNTDEMVFCSAGRLTGKEAEDTFERCFDSIPANPRSFRREPFVSYRPEHKVCQMNTWQNHCIIGTLAYDLQNEKRYGLHLLNNVLGGQGLNSRLNMSLREKNGLAYNVESHYAPYFDTGILTIYFGTERSMLRKSLDLAYREMEKLQAIPLGKIQMNKARKQMLGYMVRSAENAENLIQALGKSILVHDRVDSREEITEQILNITAEDLREIAREILNTREVSTLIYE